MDLDQAALDGLLERARKEVDEGLLPACQLAIAKDGELVAFETYGDATNDTRFTFFSCTKALVAGLVWQLIGDGALDVSKRVVDYFPEFGANGKDVVTVEQVLLHTSGFPQAPMNFDVAATREGRIERMASWRLNWEPGTRYEYHPTSAHWVLAELISRLSGGADHCDVLHERITEPLGLPRLLGVTGPVAELQVVGDPMTPEELEAATGLRDLDVGEVTDDNLLRFNEPVVRAIGVPGGGGVMRASDLALYYQAVLHDPLGLWKPEVLADAKENVRCMLPDPMVGTPAWRTLGLVRAGDDGTAAFRSFGKACSPAAFGHAGAHGQVGWADPATGISFAYATNGMDRNPLREGRRSVGLGSRAALVGRSSVGR